ncbi:chitobiase/beta-hexosaminidase C-terminal domain-containing protein [Methanobacterium sp.]|uniref:chitobiase/beta-hexosaminidase C-terminal domain-containing protein n=1 Tax=Methanobacterium sp. TaxID=2164 RepID=UPI003C78EBA4
MKKNNNLPLLMIVFAVLFIISVPLGTVSAAETENTGPTITTSLTGGTYNTTKTVTLTANDSNAIIYYTNDTTDPRTSSTRKQYTNAITISKTTTLRYAAVDTAGNWSKLYLQNYVIGTGKTTNNTGQSNYTGPKTNNTNWAYTVTDGCRIDGSAAVGQDGTIYFGTINGETKEGYFYAFNPNKTLKWKYHTGGIRSTPIIGADGTIYVKNYNGTEYAFNPNGTLKWSSTEPTVNSGFATIGADGTRYIINKGLLYAYNPDKTLKWIYNTETMYGLRLNSLSGTPIIGTDGTIYVRGIYNVVYQDSTIGTIIATQKFNLYAVNPDGTTKWVYETCYGGSDPVIGLDGTIYVTVDKHAFANPEGVKLLAINPDGTVKWSYTQNTNDGIGSLSVAKDGTIYFASNGYIYAYNPNGSEKWKYTVDGNIHGCTIGADGTIYFGRVSPLQVYGTDQSGYSDLFALNPNGTLKWKYHIGGILSSPTIGPDGTLYVGGRASSTFYAIKDDTTKPTASANIKTGLYNANRAIKISMSENGTIYYTLNGSTPTKSSTIYKGPISITSTTTLKFIAVDNAGNISPVYTEKYTIDKAAPKIASIYLKKYTSGYSRTGTITIKLNENIKTSINWSKVVVKNKYGKAVSINKWIDGDTLYIKTNSKRSSYSYYTVYIPVSAVKDYACNNFAGYTFKFKTGRY